MISETYDFPTLPDYLAPNMRLVFIGINPSVYSVQRGHYFARSTSRFWPAFSRSRLSAPIRHALSRAVLGPADDVLLPGFGIGFTDVVKTPSNNVSTLRPVDYELWSPRLLDRLKRSAPRMACFHGVTGYRAFARYVLNSPKEPAALGLQDRRIGDTRIFVAPNPSPANAHYRLEDQVRIYDQLSEVLESFRG